MFAEFISIRSVFFAGPNAQYCPIQRTAKMFVFHVTISLIVFFLFHFENKLKLYFNSIKKIAVLGDSYV